MESYRRLGLILTVGGLVSFFVLPLNPVGSKLLKLAIIASLCGAWLGGGIFLWKEKQARVALFLPVIFLVVFLSIPGRAISTERLRSDYVAELKGFEGVDYVWGGESPRGIDCSGLPRRALRQALLKQVLRNHSSEAFRQFLKHWWFDSSARALSEGYREYAIPLEKMTSIREGDYSGLQPGDFAVTGNGTHLIVYLGKEQWIQADPGPRRVWTQNARTAKNGWFDIPVTTHRWTVLNEP